MDEMNGGAEGMTMTVAGTSMMIVVLGSTERF